MGAAHGEACRGAIHELYGLRIANAIEQAMTYGQRQTDETKLLGLAERSRPIVERFHPEGWEEIEGIAAGAGLQPIQVWAMNALTDLRDVAAFAEVPAPDGLGCSSFVVQGNRTAGRPFCGQTWDLMTDNMPFVHMVRRRPVNGPTTLCLTTTGCLSLIGMNEHGVAIGTTNIRAYDSRLGVGYLDVIHRALNARSLTDARRVIEQAPRAGAHYFYVLDAAGAAVAIECTATQHHSVSVETGGYVHCNHMVCASNLELEVKGTPMGSSAFRQQRLTTLLNDGPAPLNECDLMAFLGDAEGGENAISRHDFNGISSNGAVVMEPAAGQLWAVHGPADQGQWVHMLVAG